jgi:hypothetical protein
MRFLIMVSILIFQVSIAFAEEVYEMFEALDKYYEQHPRKISPDLKALSSVVADERVTKYLREGIHVHYVDSLTVLISKRLDGGYGINGKFITTSEFPEGPIATRVLKTHISKDSTTLYTIDFSPGMSVDPYFFIFEIKGDSTRYIGSTPFCTDIYFPGDGFIYTAGHVDSTFDMRRIYRIENGKLVEIPQPFYYVGLETVTKEPITLFADRSLKTGTVSIPAGNSLTVLINIENSYLILTSSGITGWIQIEYGGYYSPIKHLILRGD